MKTFREIALQEKEETHGVFIGRMQPVTLAHAKIIETIAKENTSNTVFLVKGKITSKDKDKNPFNVETQKKMLELIVPKNVKIEIISSGFFVDKLNEMEDGTKFIAYAGSDRVKAYEKFATYIEGTRTLEVKEIKRTGDDISATKVRNALKEDDEDTFKKMTPKNIHKMYKELKEIVS